MLHESLYLEVFDQRLAPSGPVEGSAEKRPLKGHRGRQTSEASEASEASVRL